MPSHRFGEGSFSNELWIANKRVFSQPTDVTVEIITRSTFDWLFADPEGNIVKTSRVDDHSGWTGVNLPSLGLFGDYSIGFRNAGSGTIQIKQGEVLHG